MAKKTSSKKSSHKHDGDHCPECDPLFPDCMKGVKEYDNLQEHPEDENVYSAFLESQCGATDDSQAVEQYDGTLGVTVDFVNANQAAVGQIQWNTDLASKYDEPGNVSGARWCTGTMVSKDLFLTAGHCFDQTGGGWVRPKDNDTGATISPAEIATNMHVNFNYQRDPSGVMRTAESFPVVEMLEYRLGGLDFAVLRLGGDPGLKYGTVRVSTTDAEVGQMVAIIGHPAGQPKRIEAGPVFDMHGHRIGYDDIDTLGGNSGSGIIRAADSSIVGVHTNGGCNPAGTGHNHGVRISSILAQSTVLNNLPPQITNPSLDRNTSPLRDAIVTSVVQDKITSIIADRKPTTPWLDIKPTNIWADRRPTSPWADKRPTSPWLDNKGSLKNLDDVKLPGRDKIIGDRKLPGSDWRGGFRMPGGVRPFVMETPHHSMWASEADQYGQGADDILMQYEAMLEEMQQMIEQGSVELQEMQEEFEALLAEYEAMING